MTTWRNGLLLAAAGLTVGCVDRRYVVETNVPGAQVSVDGVPIGAAPADARWEYAGDYEFKAVAPGYEPLTQRVTLRPKWHNYPPLDFFAEVLWPFRIEDVRQVQLVLEPVRPVNQVELLNAAIALREKGLNLPPPTIADETPLPPGPPQTAPPVAPPVAPIPTNIVPPFQVAPPGPAPALPLTGRVEPTPPPPGPVSGDRR
ncbi:MAG TPA: PEGA domain-containing protein [Fimbriiglobus sp.]|nr:PEGA domain-containing protein [Fimbriiglobus sp.]